VASKTAVEKARCRKAVEHAAICAEPPVDLRKAAHLIHAEVDIIESGGLG